MASTAPPILPITNSQTVPSAAPSSVESQPPIATPAFRNFINQITETVKNGLSQRRPWAELADRSSLSKPESISDAALRIRKNYSYFKVNYLTVATAIVGFSLVTHPFSLVFLLCLLASWLFLYMFRPSDSFGNYSKAREAIGVSCPSNPTQDHHQKKPSQATAAAALRPQPPDLALRCPRCDSTNTKFCYYNNYSLSQPRYFCKSCRRYWTKGGTLRNIPVGGGCRKNKRSTSSATRSLRTTPEPAFHDGKAFSAASFNGYNNNEQIDLSLAFALLNKQRPGNSSHLGLPSEFGGSHHDMEDVFGTSQQKVNAGYAFGNGSSGLDIAMGDPNKVLWGFPWQMNGESLGMMNIGGGGHVDEIDSGREIWTNMNYINSGALM